ncbi:MAG TPA: tetratricopeptide repeat protein [Steroidobacteraceae bacterium]|nr:tetratricopeptide repeat protein [Steroidobacteraceae bacterium]
MICGRRIATGPARAVPLLSATAAAAGLLLAGTFLTLAAPAQAAPQADVALDSDTLIMTAEIALRRDDCGRASADYVEAARRLTDAKVAQRAADVALDCGQYQTAEQAAARWRQLQPRDAAPLRASMRAALGLYQIDAARSDFEGWMRSNSTAIDQQLQQVADESGVPATLAMLEGVHDRPLQSANGQLAMADLAMDGWNYREALQYAQHALDDGAARGSAQFLLARAHAGLGEADQAVAAATAARQAAPKEQSFADADVLLLLGRDGEARASIESVLSQNPSLHSQAQRRLGLLAFDSGDYDDAQRDFQALLGDRDSAAVAVYYLSLIAERRDDAVTALRGYQLLAGTALEPTARMRAATLLFKHGHSREALQLLGPGPNATPAARVQAEIAQAELLSDGGQADQALARLDDALARAPGHPDLLYQRAIVLEKGGRTDAAIAQLEQLYHARPQDGEIANALGFILADHDRDLGRAQRLIGFALKGEPDNPAILDSLGWLDFRRGMPQAALPLLERAFRLDQDGDIGAHWGEVLWSVGQKARARDAWSRALLADPDNAAVKAAEKRAGAPQLLNPGAGTSV